MEEGLGTLILKTALTFLTWYFGKKSNESEAKKQFLLFVDALERDGLAKARLSENDRNQLNELRQKRGL